MMNARLKKQAEALAALSVEDRHRLERLAELARTHPEIIWPEVCQYGFDDVEESVQADLDADEDIAAGRTISNEEVMAQARRILEANVKNRRKTG
jgi:predicted transcriptional regulator